MKKNKFLKLCYIFIITIILSTNMSIVYADDVDNEEFLETQDINEVVETISNNVTEMPSTNSRRTVVYDRKSKTVLFGKNEDTKSAMASTTKIMTATIVLENASLNEKVTVSSKAGGTGGSRLGLKKGDEATVNDLLYGLMLRSGNDAAVALAEHVGGSVSEFANKMNKKAEELGLVNTHFVTPHGLDNSEHYTTAYELAKLTDYALENSKFAEIVGTKFTTIYINNQPRQISNTNELLGVLNGVVGVKTGFTNNAGRCLVTETKREDLDIITVVLGADTTKFRTKDSIALIEYTYSNYRTVDLEEKIIEQFNNWKNINQERIKITQCKEKNLQLTIGEIEIKELPIRKDEIDDLQYEINAISTIEAPVKQWEKFGDITVKLNNEIIQSVEIINTTEIDRITWKDYFKYLIKLQTTTIF